MDTSVPDKVPYLENFASTKDVADNNPDEMADCSDEIPCSSQTLDNLHLNITGTRNKDVNPVSVTGTLFENISQDTGRRTEEANEDVEDTDRGHKEIKIEEVFQSFPLAIDNTPENLQVTNIYTCTQDRNIGLLNPLATIDGYRNVLPEEIQAELTAHAQYHHLKSTTEQNLSHQGQLVILERNPDSQSGNPDPGSESHRNIKHEPNEQYADSYSDNVCNGNYYGSESSVCYISSASSVQHKLPRGLVPQEPVTPIEKRDSEDQVYLHYQIPATKKSCKKNNASHSNNIATYDSTSILKTKTHLSKNHSHSRPQANVSKVPKKRGRPKKIQSEKTSQQSEHCTSYLNGSKWKSNEDIQLQHLPDLEEILKFKLSPCSVRLSRLEDTENNSSTNGICEQTSVRISNKKTNKQLSVPRRKKVCKQEALEESDILSKISLKHIEDYSLNDKKSADIFKEKKPGKISKKRQKIEKVVQDITFNDDIESDDTYSPVEISDDEYTPKNNHSLHKAFLKSSKVYKINNDSSASGVKSKIKFSKGEGKQIKEETFNEQKSSMGTRKTQALGRFLCKKCGFRADKKKFLQQHYKEEHSQPWITCHFCEKKFKSPDCLLEHEAKLHTKEKPFRCHVDGCGYASSNRTDLSRHQVKHSTEKKHACPLCGWTTKWFRNVRVHYLMKHTEEKRFKCNLCKYTCKRNTELRQHMFRHTDDKPIQCVVCGFSVKTSWELKSHMLSHSDEKPFKCNIPGCKFAAKTNADRLKHMRLVHTVDRKHVCSVCGKGFKTIPTLNRHYSYTHVDTRAFKCDICSKAFKLKSALKNHVRRHTGYKPHVCTVCNHAFGNSSNLKTHMKTHDFTARPYRCPLCPHGAKKKEHLFAHIATCHADTSCYCCELCKKPFQSYAKLQVHYKKMHKHELSKFNNEDHIDLALLKMEMDLEEEKYSRRKNKAKRKTNKIDLLEEATVQIKEEPLDDGYENVGTETIAKCENNNTTEATAKTDRVYTIQPVLKMCDTSRDDALQNGSETVTSAGDELSQLLSDGNDEVNFSVSGNDAMIKDNERVQNESEKQKEKATGVSYNLENGSLRDGSNPFVTNEIKASDSLASKNCFTLAIYNGLRLPLATRGFEFNYEKSGQKPKAWFMDVDVMNKRDAEKQKAYLRRIGQLPTLRGRYKRKVSGQCLKQRKKKNRIADPKSRMTQSVQSEQDVESTQLKNLEKSNTDEDQKIKSEDLNFKNTHQSVDKESEKLSNEQTLPPCIYESAGTEVRKGEKRKRQLRQCKVNSSIGKGSIKKFKATKPMVEKEKSECRRTGKKGKRRKTRIKESHLPTTETDTTSLHKTSSEICDKTLTEICDTNIGDNINTEKYAASTDREQIAANVEHPLKTNFVTKQVEESNKSCGSFNLSDVNNFCDDVVVMKEYEQLYTVLGDAITISSEMSVSSEDGGNSSQVL